MTAAMPVFPLAADDTLALAAIALYYDLCLQRGLTRRAEQVQLAWDEMVDWRAAHPDAVKLPDHDHVPATTEGTTP